MSVGRDGIPAIPDLPPDTPASLRPFLESLRQVVSVRAGQNRNQLDRSPTMRELLGNNVITFLGNGNTAFGIDPSGIVPGSQPEGGVPGARTPVNVQTHAALSSIGISWEGYELGTRGEVYAEIWRNTVDDRDTATLIGVSDSHVFPDYDVQPDTDYYYWVRAVNEDGIPGSFNATAGTHANIGKTGAIVAQEITTAMENGDVTSFVVDKDVFAVRGNGYTTDYPFIVGTVNGVSSIVLDAKSYIADASIENAQIYDLNVDKLWTTEATIAEAIIGTGEIANAMIGNYIRSDNYVAGFQGWKLDKSGWIEASSITIRDSSGNIILTSGGQYAAAIANTNQQWADIAGSGRPADNADVTVPGVGIKINQYAFTGSDNGEFYIHGYAADGSPADVDGYVYFNGNKVTCPATKVATGNLGRAGFIVFDTAKRNQFSVNGYAQNIAFAWPEDGGWVYDYGHTSNTTSFTPDEYHCAIGTIVRASWDYINSGSVYTDGIALTGDALAGNGAFAALSRLTASNISTYIADLAVDTLQIAGNAVIVPLADHDDYPGGLGDNSTSIVVPVTDNLGALLVGATWVYDDGPDAKVYLSATPNNGSETELFRLPVALPGNTSTTVKYAVPAGCTSITVRAKMISSTDGTYTGTQAGGFWLSVWNAKR